MRAIDADRLIKVVEGWKKPKVYSEADERQNAIIECIMYNIKCAPTISGKENEQEVKNENNDRNY